ncbi:MAG: DNA ligase D [Pseudomonadota bacterium]|jgi:bifunctional non-homologous end joining protein LigD|uniref:DNA ligase D n=1 Tax=Burkholderia sp. 4M9327F10 TaxID=2502223 RepID=UPI0010F6501F|nr:DNA ligase D [Burkholderia sp. 4M9327F10]
MARKLETYQRKRRFDGTPEPSGTPRRSRTTARAKGNRKRNGHVLSFVIQEHDARNLHYDFRLELDGTLKSWAVPKGPSLDPSVKRLAVHVEDHPLEYGSFEGEIPQGNYGAGTVLVWDRGTWEPAGGERAAHDAYEAGKLKFRLDGEKLHGGWTLVKSHMRGAGHKEQWLLIKERDDEARSEDEFDVLTERPGSVLSPHEGAAKTGCPDIVSTRSLQSLRKLAATPTIEGAVKAKLPATLKPQLATLVDAAAQGDDWSYEIKFDGYRVLARIDRQDARRPVRIHTRSGLDWSAKFSMQCDALAGLDIGSAWLDGEAAVLDERGVPDFQALQNAFDTGRPQDIVLFLFDLPYLNGYDLRAVPLVQRRALLRALLDHAGGGMLRFSEDFAVAPGDLLQSACEVALEGIVGKRRDSHYVSRRSTAWIKLRCRRRQEFVIGGYSEPAGSRTGFGALLLGVHDAKHRLQYAGRVGTGFDSVTLRRVKQELAARETGQMPFASAPRERSRTRVHWVKPELVAECNFAQWTSDGLVRQASFISLRGDKPAREIVQETPRMTTAKPTRHASKAAAPGESTVAGVRISHPERVIDKSTGTTKLDLVRYYEWIAPRMLPHLADRPVALVRTPEGLGGEFFFQKHANRLALPHITQHKGLDPGHAPLLTIESAEALVGAAQMDAIEFHTWNGLASDLERPDRMVFDLDPDAALGWDKMIEAAQLTRELLAELGLDSWCKTSGGKGLHVVVPLVKSLGWEDVKAFSQAVAQHMAGTLPDRFSAKMAKQNRHQKIFVDYLRNNRGSSTITAFSARAREGLGVSVPLSWDEVEHTTAGDQWNVGNLRQRLDALKADPWAGYAKCRQRITGAMRKRLDSSASG